MSYTFLSKDLRVLMLCSGFQRILKSPAVGVFINQVMKLYIGAEKVLNLASSSLKNQVVESLFFNVISIKLH